MSRALRLGVTVAGLGLAGALGLLVLAPTPAPPAGPEPGRSLFQAHCASCHGADGRGGSWRARLLFLHPGSLADREAASLSDQYLSDIIRHGGAAFGKPGMPSFGFTLGEAEIRALLLYLRTLAPGPPSPQPARPQP